MFRNNVIKIMLILFVGIFTIYPIVSHAGECTNDDIKMAINGNKNNIVEAVKKYKEAADKFNEKADEYIKECGEPTNVKKAMEIIDTDTKTRIRFSGEDIDERYYRNTQYYWDQIEPASEECGQLCEGVKYLKKGYDSARQKMMEEANRSIQAEKVICTCDNVGAKMMCEEIKKAKERITDECKEFSEYLGELSDCPLCGIFKILLTTIAQISKVSWDAVAKLLTNVVKVFFLVLLAIEVLKAVAAVGGVKLSEFAKNVVVLTAKVAITVLLLSNPRYVYGYFLSPVLESGLNMGVNLANSAGSGGNAAKDPRDALTIPSETFDSSVYDTVMSSVRNFGVGAAELPAIGRGLSCHAWDSFPPSVSMWITGALFYILGIIIWLAVSFYMIDCTVQIAMLSGLVPFLIACWPFDMTKSYTYKGCKMLMNSFFSYVMIGVVLLISTQVCLGSLTGTNSDATAIIEAINTSDLKKLKKLCELGGFQILILGACAVFAIKIIGTANDLADQFSKGSGSRIGSKVGGLAASAVTNAGKGAAKLGLRGVGIVGKHAAAATGVTAKVHKVGDSIKGGWQKGWAVAGRGVGLGKYQNQQTGSGKEGAEGGGDKHNPNGGGNNTNPQNNAPNPNVVGNNTNPQNNTPNPNGGDSPSIRDSDGRVTLANGEKVNGLGVATRNPDGGVTFTSKGSDGSKTIDSYDKDGNRKVQSFDGKGEMTSSFQQNKDGSSSGFIKREDGSIDRWDDKPGTYRNVGAVQEREKEKK